VVFFSRWRITVPTLNRFPLLGLWAKEAARRLDYTEADAQTIGHAYAVLYAIRANSPTRPTVYKDQEAAARAAEVAAHPAEIEELTFAGDRLEVSHDRQGRLVGRVGGQLPQTPESFRYKVKGKFPAGYFDKVESAFRAVLASIPPERLDSRMIYQLYDQWKKQCARGRLVDLDKLLAWCEERARTTAART
jgi:hypothetical protein